MCGVDLVGTAGFNFQLKNMERAPAYHDILNFMPQGENTNVIIHKKNRKGIVAVLPLEAFIELVKKANYAI